MSPKNIKQVYVPRFGSQSSSHNHSGKPQEDSQQTNVKITQKSKAKAVYKEVQLLPRKKVVAKVMSPVKPNRMTMKKSNQPTSKSSSTHNSTVSKGTTKDY